MSGNMRGHRKGCWMKDGRFRTVRQYTGPDGLPVRKVFVTQKRLGETPKQVGARADKWLAEHIGKLPTPSMTLERAVELYIEHREDADISPETLRDDKYVAGLVKPLLGAARIDRLDAFGVELGLKEWKEHPRTAKKIRDFGRKLYRWLAKRRWVDSSSNPFELATPPKYEPVKWEEPVAPSDFDLALARVPRDDYRAMYLLQRWTGIRPVSSRELAWPEIVEDKEGRMWIRKAKAKTGAGTKPIFVPNPAAEAIRRLPRKSVLVFPSPKTGRPYNETTIGEVWRKAQREAGVEVRKVYDLKHMRVTELTQVLDDVEIAVAVGMKSAETVRNHYRQVNRRQLANRMEEAGVTGSVTLPIPEPEKSEL